LQESSQTKCRSLDAELKAALEKISKLEKELVAFKNETANSISSLKAELVTFHKNIDEIEKELVAHKNEATSLIRSISVSPSFLPHYTPYHSFSNLRPRLFLQTTKLMRKRVPAIINYIGYNEL
jgi:hypothetical protein